MTSSIVIEELTGRRRRLTLLGGGLPKHGSEFPSSLNVVTKWLPGASEATQQVIGPQDGSPDWEGYWDTAILAGLPCGFQDGAGAAAQRIARAQSLVTIVESMMQGGQKLRVRWAQDDDHSILREGRIVEFKPTYRTKDEVNWSLSWAWTGRGGSAKRVVSLKKDAQLAKHKQIETELTKLRGELTASSILSFNKDIFGSASFFSLGKVEGLLDRVRNFTGGFAKAIERLGSTIKQIGDLAQSVEELPADIAQQFVDAAATVMSDCAAFSDAVTRQGPETYARFDQSASVSTILHAAKSLSDAKAASDAVVLACVEARATLLKKGGQSPEGGAQGKPEPSLAAVVIARQGDTFASLAKRYLGDPSFGPAVAKASGYNWLDLTPKVGDVVLIPNASAAAKAMPGA